MIGAALTPDGRIQRAHFELAAGRTGMVLEETPVSPGLEEKLFSADEGKERILQAGLVRGRWQIVAVGVSGPVGPRIAVDDLVSMSVSRTGHRVVAGTKHGVEIYDGFTGELVGEIPGPKLQGVFVTLTDQLFVSSLGGELTQYDLESLRPVRTFGGSLGYVQDVVGTNDGSLIAAPVAIARSPCTTSPPGCASGRRSSSPRRRRASSPCRRTAIGWRSAGATRASRSGTSIPPSGLPRLPARRAQPRAGRVGDQHRQPRPYRATCPGLPVDP